MNRTEYHRQLRIDAVEVLGGKCCVCGFEDKRALQIDHVNNNGKQERAKRVAIHNRIIKDPTAKKEYQLLCANCNWIKHIINNRKRLSPTSIASPNREGIINKSKDITSNLI